MELSIEFRVKEVQLYIGAYMVCFVCMYVYCVYLCMYVRTCTYIHVSRDSVCTIRTYVLIILFSNVNIQLLLAYGSPLLRKNTLGKTPCDLASDCGQFVIVKLLEPKMVFVVSECVECYMCV